MKEIEKEKINANISGNMEKILIEIILISKKNPQAINIGYSSRILHTWLDIIF